MSAPSNPTPFPSSRRPALAALAFLALLAGMLGSSAWSASAAPLSLTSGITAYWKLDEANGNRTDLAAGLVLTDTNTVTQAGGKLGYAAQFTASNLETLSIADNATLSTGDINYTWSAWAWTDSLGTVARPILAKWASSPNGEYLLILNADNTVQFFIANGSANNNVTASQTITATETWHLFIAWHDAGANEICLQIDDSTPDCAATTITPTDRGESFKLSGRDSNNQWWDGRIDSVGFWKRVLTSGERARLWNGGLGCDYPFHVCEAAGTATATSGPGGPTETPAPTTTPAYLSVASLDSGDQLWIERRWTWGELFTGLAVVALAAILALRWVYDVVIRELHQEARRD